MPKDYKGLRRVLKNQPFILLLVSEGISALGDAFQVVAVATLLVKMTGSGLAAGFAIICTPLPSVFLSPFAGVLGDKFREKHVLIVIDVLRGFIVLLFTMNYSIYGIYILLLALSSLDILYSPSRSKMLSHLLESRDLTIASSIQSGVLGAAYMLGPVLAGFAVGFWGVNPAFYINSVSFIFSAFLILLVRTNYSGYPADRKKRLSTGIYRSVKDSFEYCRKISLIKELMTIGFFISLGTVSINITFYTFAFDTLGITSKSWGIMLSTLYGTNMIAMLLTMLVKKKSEQAPLRLIYLAVFVVSMVWLSYGFVKSLPSILLLQLVEGTALSFCSILLSAHLLIASKKGFVARVAAGNDLTTNMGKLLGIAFTYTALQFLGPRHLFIIHSEILLLFAGYKLLTGKMLQKNSLSHL